jgi:hypothetical protein
MIKDIADKFNNPDVRIKWAREYNDKMMLHVHGVGLKEALAKINNYENDKQKDARDLFAHSNKYISDRLLRPTDNVFSAKGGYRKYIFDSSEKKIEDAFVERLVDVYSGYNLSQYIHRVWFDKYVCDPNGLIFIEVNEDGTESYPTYKSIKSIRNYKQDGIKVEWVIFDPHETVFDEERPTDIKKELFWAVDSEGYYLCEKAKGDIRIIETKANTFGEVPAIICSDISDNVSGWKKSPIDAQVELLDKIMVDNSVLNIVGYFHNYPQQWVYVSDCPRCSGTGQITEGTRDREGNIDFTCPSCGGSGKQERKDVTDIIRLGIPQANEQKIDPPSGYVYMPTDPMKMMMDVVDRTWNMIIYSHWGTSLEYGGADNKYQTATGRFIDTQPVNNRLNRYTESVEIAHTTLVSYFGKFYYPKQFKKAEIKYGRRYLIETPDQLLKRYGEISNLTENVLLLDITWDQYLESEFRENELLLEYYKKLNALDPMPHVDASKLKELGLEDELRRKLYIIEYKSTKDIYWVIKTPLDKLRADYSNYLTLKKNE